MSLIKVKTGWKRLEGLDAWKAELKTLLEEANAAASSNASGPRLKIAAHLAGFIQESAPQSDEMDLLDDIARKLATDVLESTIEARLASIAERTAEYAQLEKTFNAAAVEAERAAESTRLTGVVRFIEAASETVTSAKDLAASLNTNKASERKVADLINDTVTALEKLRSAVGRLV